MKPNNTKTIASRQGQALPADSLHSLQCHTNGCIVRSTVAWGAAMWARLSTALFLLVAGPACEAANVTSTVTKEGTVYISLSGEITEGDSNTFKALIKSANDSGRIVTGVRLNSVGGNLLEGVKLAELIRFARVATVVVSGAKCASACFLAFAAGGEKFVSYSAFVGVHGAADRNGRETADSDTGTVAMARVAKDLGVSTSIIGKMVITPPDEIIWLTANDLRSMGATLTGKPVQVQSDVQASVACDETKSVAAVSQGLSRQSSHLGRYSGERISSLAQPKWRSPLHRSQLPA
jgi:hypothetical protein